MNDDSYRRRRARRCGYFRSRGWIVSAAPIGETGVCPYVDFSAYAGSTSIVLLATSTLVIRKLRTWPARTGSVFEAPGAGPLFQRSLSIELSEARSAALDGSLDFSSLLAALTAGTRHRACTPSPSSTRDSLPD